VNSSLIHNFAAAWAVIEAGGVLAVFGTSMLLSLPCKLSGSSMARSLSGMLEVRRAALRKKAADHLSARWRRAYVRTSPWLKENSSRKLKDGRQPCGAMQKFCRCGPVRSARLHTHAAQPRDRMSSSRDEAQIHRQLKAGLCAAVTMARAYGSKKLAIPSAGMRPAAGCLCAAAISRRNIFCPTTFLWQSVECEATAPRHVGVR